MTGRRLAIFGVRTASTSYPPGPSDVALSPSVTDQPGAPAHGIPYPISGGMTTSMAGAHRHSPTSCRLYPWAPTWKRYRPGPGADPVLAFHVVPPWSDAVAAISPP